MSQTPGNPFDHRRALLNLQRAGFGGPSEAAGCAGLVLPVLPHQLTTVCGMVLNMQF